MGYYYRYLIPSLDDEDADIAFGALQIVSSALAEILQIRAGRAIAGTGSKSSRKIAHSAIEEMVAEVRSGHNSRQHERTEISLGTWQIELKRAIKQYLEKTRKAAAADNDDAAASKGERSGR